MANIKYRKIAKSAIDRYMRQNPGKEDFTLYELSVVADKAAFAAGKKYELFSSLCSYETLVPKGAKVFWKKTGSSGGILSVINPYCPKNRKAEEAVLILGPFDEGVDMGPDHWREMLKSGKAV
jgi:hypothetical protein